MKPFQVILAEHSETGKLISALREKEAQILQALVELQKDPDNNSKWLDIGREYIELGFMAIIRSIQNPPRR